MRIDCQHHGHLIVRQTILFAGMLALVIACRRPAPPTSSSQRDAQTHAAGELFVQRDAQAIARNNRGVGLMGKFEYEQARVIFRALADEYPAWLDVQVNLAIATLNRQQEGDEQAALVILDRVLQSDPAHLRAHYCTGLLKLYLQSPQDALTHFRIVADADSRDAYAAYYVGQCLAQDRKYEEAVQWYEKAIANDSYLRSAYYAASQSYRALNNVDEAKRMLEEFQRLERNPRARQVKFVYTQMGPRAEATTVDLHDAAKQTGSAPDGPLFLDPEPLLKNSQDYNWVVRDPTRAVSITACDINGDGYIDLFMPNILDRGETRNCVLINQGNSQFVLDQQHPFATIPDVNAALWGDFDNDGLTDVYYCRRGPNMLWRQSKANEWTDVTAATGTANGELDTVDGAIFDADHDGDLDIFCVNANGPNELFSNNLDGTFRAIAKEKNIAGAGNGSRQVLPVDLDSDRDVDIIVINNVPPHDVWINDRLWNYHQGEGVEELRDRILDGILARFGHAAPELITLEGHSKFLNEWRWNDAKQLQARIREGAGSTGASPRYSQFQLVDVAGDGGNIVLRNSNEEKLAIVRPDGGQVGQLRWPGTAIVGFAAVVLEAGAGASVVAALDHQPPVIWRPGPGRYPFAAVSFTGRTEGDTMRSNASGIGTHFAARIDSTWVIGSTLRYSSGPGQSLQPVAIGLRGEKQIDFISIEWSDGVFQSEIDLPSGKLHTIAEKQRQLSSCPVLFAWNGHKYEFVTDILGVGGIGFAIGPDEYAPSRPWENLLLPAGLLQPKNGRFVLKMSEPMEEACYLDSAKLVAYDLPPGWQMTIDDRMNIGGPVPTGEPRFYQELMTPVRARNDLGDDVTEHIGAADLRAAPVGALDHRFIGRLLREHALTLTFDQPIGAAEGGSTMDEDTLLIVDGWIEYPYSQTMFAAWQAGATYRAPTVEARDEDGQWRTILREFGYPAGMPRQMSVPLKGLPRQTLDIRISTNQEIYWDRIAIVRARPLSEVVVHELPMRQARLLRSGFAQRSTGPQRQPHYDYDRRVSLWDTRHQRGYYTEFGECLELVTETDNALAIFGPGEEIHLEFDAHVPDPPSGWSRRFVLQVRGWCKDMDLYTKDGDSIEPLPASDNEISEIRERLHRLYNVRYEAGR